jgi:hypothetical protein
MGPGPDQTGHAAADPRRISAAGTAAASIRGPRTGPQQPRRVLPILPAPARAGSRQDVRSASRAPGAQLPEPSIMGPGPDQTGHAAADPRRISRAGTRCSFDQRAQDGPQQPPRVLQILPGPGAQLPEPSIMGTRPGSDRPRCRRSTPDLRSRYRCSLDQRAQDGPAAAPEGAAHPPGLARAGSRQDVRSAARTPGAQLPKPSIMGTRPHNTEAR